MMDMVYGEGSGNRLNSS